MEINETFHDMVIVTFKNLSRREFSPENCSVECSLLIDLDVLCIDDEAANQDLPVASSMTFDPVNLEVMALITYVAKAAHPCNVYYINSQVVKS